MIVEEDGSRAERASTTWPTRRPGSAAWLGEQGVRRGDAVVLMLGNQVELWESMLAVMKLGAVIMPTTTAAGPADWSIASSAAGAPRHLQRRRRRRSSTTCPGTTSRICVGAADGWADLRAAVESDAGRPVEHPGTGPRRPAAAVLHVRHHAQPKLVEHTQVSYPRGAPDDDVLAGAAAGRRAPEHLLAGLGQARLVLLLRAVDRRGDGVRLQLPPLRRRPPAEPAARAARSPPSARRRRSGGCSSRPTCPAARARCARWSARASR